MLLKNGHIIRPGASFTGDLRIRGEKIVELGQLQPEAGEEVLDCSGMILLPGGIETHTHLQLESMGTVTADDFASGTKAALAGGTCTVLDFATQFHGESLKEGTEHWNRKIKDSLFCDVGYHMAMTEWNDDLRREMAWAVDYGMPSFKLYMAYKNNMMVRDDEIYEALEESKRLSAVIGFHCENGDLVDKVVRQLKEQGKLSPYWHAKSRPAEFEAEAIRRLETIALQLNAPHYVVHLSAKEGLKEIRRARRKGSPVVAETCPQYLLLDESRYGEPEDDNFEAAKYIMSPPLRAKKNQKPLWKGLARGDIQFVGTDHCSFRMKDQKTMGRDDFSKIPNGAPGIELRMLLLYTYGVLSERLSLERYAQVTAENAARYFGLYPQKGILAEGSDADVLVLDPAPYSRVRSEDLLEKADYTPYEGFEIRGRFRQVFLRGQKLVENGQVIDAQPHGKWLAGHCPDTNIR